MVPFNVFSRETTLVGALHCSLKTGRWKFSQTAIPVEVFAKGDMFLDIFQSNMVSCIAHINGDHPTCIAKDLYR